MAEGLEHYFDDHVTGDEVCAWVEAYCRYPDGPMVGQPVKLSDIQREWIRTIFDTPTRLFILSVGRKNAKTALIAFLMLCFLVGPLARRNSQIYSAAQSKEQAALVFSYARQCVLLSEDLRAHVKIRPSAKEMECEDLGTFYKALSADAVTTFGKNPRLVLHDELGQVRGPNSDLYDALETATGTQDNPLSIIISTQAKLDSDLLSVLIDDCLTGADPTKKCILHTAPEDIDPFSDEAIRAANPHFDVFMNQDEVRRQAEDARRMPSKENSFRNLVLNQRVDATSPFVSKSVWDGCGAVPEFIPGERLFGGLDLSEVADLTALELVGEQSGAVESWFWLPEEGIKEKARTDRVPYDVWAKQGFLQTTPGPTIQYSFVAEQLRKLFDERTIGVIAFDAYNWKHLKPWLQRAGFTDKECEENFRAFGQGFVSMSPAVRELESRLLRKQLAHGGHPVLAMCAANAVIVKDPAGNRKFHKAKSTGRIDGMVALAMAVTLIAEEEVDSGDFDRYLNEPLVL